MSGRLVGRDPVVAVTSGALEDALAGAGRLLLVTGDPGIGKTALARYGVTMARGQGARVVWTSCPPGGGAPAYWPWSQLVRALGDDAHAAGELLAGRGAHRDDATARFELHEAVIAAIARYARASGALVVFDDLQWADEPSLELLAAASRGLGAARVLMLGTYRDLEAPASLDRLAAGAEALTLGGLDAAAVSGLVTTITGTALAGEEADRLRSRTGGNPLFVRELARLMVARGTGTTDSNQLPATVADTLRQRLTGLTDACRDLLSVVAVADTTDLDLLAGVTSLHAEELARLLAEARMARVLVEAAAPERPFVHDLYRETILAELTGEQRRRRHAELADAWIRHPADDDSAPAGRIAAHLSAAVPVAARPAEIALAVLWLSRAAAEATARTGHEEAVRLHRRAVELTRGADPALLLALAESELRAGDHAAHDTFLAAAQAARTANDGAALTRAALGLHRLGARGDHDSQVALIEEAAVQAVQGSEDRALLLAALARELRHASGPVAVWQNAAERAVRAAREFDAPRVLATCLLALHDALWTPGSAPERLVVLEEMADAASAAGDAELGAQACVLRAACLLELNERSGLVELAHYCQQEEELGHARARWEATSRTATLGLITGALDDAARASAEAFAIGTRMGIPDATGVYGTLRWPLSLFTGDRLAILDIMIEIDLIPMRDAFAAAAFRTEGDADQARRIALTLSLEVLPTEKYDLEFEALAAEALAAAGRNPETERCYHGLLPHAGTNVVVGGCASFWGPVDLYLGHLAVALEEPDAARGHYSDAAAMATALGAPRWRDLAADLRDSVSGGSSSVPRFVRAGDVWTLSWQGQHGHVPDSKGIQDLACLVGRLGSDVAATELMGTRPVAGADPVLDDVAKAAYRRRLADLDSDIADAEADHDPARVERCRDEREALIDELSAAVGLGGRDRRLGDDAERARKAVTARIRDAVRRISEVHPTLGAHLDDSVRTGAWCVYRPD